MDVRTKSTFLTGAATNWFAFAATLGVSFFLTPYLVDSLGKPRYDVWCVAESVLAYFTLLDMGLAACLVRYVAKHHAGENRDGLNRMASTSLVLFLGAGCVALIVGAPILWGLAQRLEDKTAASAEVLPFLLLMLLNLSATLALSLFPSILDGLQRFTAKSIVRILFLTGRTIGIVAVMRHGGGLFDLAIVYTISNILEHATMALLAFRFVLGLKLGWSWVDRNTFRDIRGYSGNAFLAMLAGRITVQTGAIVIGLFLPAGEVTFFVTAARLVEYAKTLLRTITSTLTPGVSAMEARDDFAGIAKLMLNATKWVLVIVIPVNLGLWFFAGPFLERWVGPDFVNASVPAVAILATTLSIGVAQSVASRILYGLGQLRLFARLALGEAGLNLILMMLLIRPLGVEGVAVAVAVPNLIFCIAVIAVTLVRLRIQMLDYLKQSWAMPMLFSIIPATIWLLQGTVQAQWLDIFWAGAMGLIPYIVAVAAWELYPKLHRCGTIKWTPLLR